MEPTSNANLPDAREGIVGRDLDPNGILSLQDDQVETRKLITNLARNLYSACLCAITPKLQEMFQRLDNPQPGDLVVGASIPDSQKNYRGFGLLLAHRHERVWLEYEQEWTREDVWYVQYGPAAIDICRWTNASFTVVPTEIMH